MKNKINKAFTIIEITVVVVIIWILTLWMTIYLDWTWDRAKNIEAESCANSFLWNINNFLFYTLTSKTLKPDWGDEVSPKYYTIQLSWWNSNWTPCTKSNFDWNSHNYCNQIVLWYISWDEATPSTYKTYSINNACQQNRSKIWFYRSWDDLEYIKMNKWFSPITLQDNNVFFITTDDNNNKLLYGDIIILRCYDDNCESRRELWKWAVDARTQTISYVKCKFYDENQLNKCATFEDEIENE